MLYMKAAFQKACVMLVILGIVILTHEGFSTFSNRILINSNLGGPISSTQYQSFPCMGQNLVGESSSLSFGTYFGFMYFAFDDTCESWSTDITVTGETGSAPNVFTVTIGCGDSSFIPAPPAPPQYMVWTELYEPGWVSGPYSEMIYPDCCPEDTTIWLLYVDPNGNVMPPESRTAIVGWDSSALSPMGEFYIEDLIGTIIVPDMRTQGSFQVTGSSDQYFNIVWVPFPGPHFTLEPSSHDFGTWSSGSISDTTTFWIINDGTGGGSGTIDLSNTLDFGTDAVLPYAFTLAVGETLSVDVWFISQLPTGLKTGQLVVDGDEPANDVSAELQGTTSGCESWSTDITVTGEQGSAPNVFTVTIGCGDSSFIPAPPAPPQYMVWTVLYEPEWVSGPWSEMIYPDCCPEDTTIWLLYVDPNGNVVPPISRTAVVSWNPSTLSSVGCFSIREYFTGSVQVLDMRLQDSLQVVGTSEQFFNILWTCSPPPPEGLVITMVGSSVHLSWVGTTSQYIVYRSSYPFDFSSASSDTVTGNEYIDTEIGDGPWFYHVTAICD